MEREREISFLKRERVRERERGEVGQRNFQRFFEALEKGRREEREEEREKDMIWDINKTESMGKCSRPWSEYGRPWDQWVVKKVFA